MPDNTSHAAILAEEFHENRKHVENVIMLLDDGNTVPFIARYRKEMHGTMDDQHIREIAERLTYLRNLDRRREEIRSAVGERGSLTEELSAALDAASTLAALEDIWRPFRQKRRTRASIAREKGLDPLARKLFLQERSGDIRVLAQAFIDPEKGVDTVEDALAGASDIIAEQISDDASIRACLRTLYRREARLVSRAAVEEDSVYRMYYDYSEPLSKTQSHRVLAVNRGEREGFLKAGIEIDEAHALRDVKRMTVKPGSYAMGFVAAAAEDACRIEHDVSAITFEKIKEHLQEEHPNFQL